MCCTKPFLVRLAKGSLTTSPKFAKISLQSQSLFQIKTYFDNKRIRKVPERFQVWKEGEKHEPFTIRHQKTKMKVENKKGKEYQRKYREAQKKNVEDGKENDGKAGEEVEKKQLMKDQKIKRRKEYQELYREKAKAKKEKKKEKNKEYIDEYRKLKRSAK